MHYLSYVLLTALAGAWIGFLRPGRRWARLLGFACLTLLFLWCWPPMARFTSATLEGQYLAGQPVDARGCGAIVVLSGGILLPNVSRPVALPAVDTFVRCAYAAGLHRQTQLPVIASGGPVGGSGGSVVASQVMRDFLVSQGVGTVWTEERSISTAENASDTAELLRSKGISRVVLVTEAHHMPRAARSFAKAGIQVVPAPCSFETAEPKGWNYLLPDYRAIRTNEDNFHEWAGLVWYRLRGAI